MGTPWRSKAFHDAYYGRMGDNTLPDQVAGMKELAQRYRFIDIDKAGIWGHSGGGFATADAMFRYPDFFKVGIAESGNHDNRIYEDDWGERYQGLLTRRPERHATTTTAEANQTLARRTSRASCCSRTARWTTTCRPTTRMLVVDALDQGEQGLRPADAAQPGARLRHGSRTYMMRRRWDYFVKNLLGAEPPKEYPLGQTVP